MTKTKGLLFTAGIMLAMAFTFSCSLDDVGGGSSSSGDGGGSSSSGDAPSSSSVADTPSSSGGESSSSDGTGFTDPRDGTRYKAVVIGTQTWLAENLNYNAPGSKCYNDSFANCETYGRLYDWETAMDVCPAGWHLPSQADWDALIMAVGDNAGTKLKAMLGWNENGNGTDEFGFSALPGGLVGDSQAFDGVGYVGIWWTANEYESNRIGAYLRGMLSDKEDVPWDKGDKSSLLSVRCLQGERQDLSSSSNGDDGSVTIGGEKYNTVKIGEQVWMAENLNYAGSDNSKGICYGNAPPFCEVYGRLYSWLEANAVCPSGWHLPSDAEWDILVAAAGGESYAGAMLQTKGGFGTSNGNFHDAGTAGYWWSASDDNSGGVYGRSVYNSDMSRSKFDKLGLFSVRCLQGEAQNLSSSSDGSSVTIGGKKYNTVKIGEQTWMAENLNYAGSDNSKGKYYNNSSTYYETYGRLYTWPEANGICPSGWHLPSLAEWNTLLDAVGGEAGSKLKAKNGWNGCGPSGYANLCEDAYGFSALPGGFGFSDGRFDNVGDSGYWWSADEFERNPDDAISLSMGYYSEDIYWFVNDKFGLSSVRCVQD